MVPRPSHRLATTLLVVLALLFSQLALANYICPTGTSQVEVVMEMAPGEPCEGMASDATQPVLCHQHCAGAPQTSDAGKVPTVSAPAVVHVLLVPVIIDAAEMPARRHPAATNGHAPPEPVFLSTLRLRV